LVVEILSDSSFDCESGRILNLQVAGWLHIPDSMHDRCFNWPRRKRSTAATRMSGKLHAHALISRSSRVKDTRAMPLTPTTQERAMVNLARVLAAAKNGQVRTWLKGQARRQSELRIQKPQASLE